MSDSVRILLIEDSASDAMLLESLLSVDADFLHTLTRVERLADGLALLAGQAFDVALTDLGLPDSQGLSAVTAIHERAPRMPLIVFTITGDMATALQALKFGAQDYISKDELVGFPLARTIRYAMERKQLMQQLQDALAEVKTLSGMLPICCSCKQVRDDKGYWSQIEAYIHTRTGAQFSHGLCPTCTMKYYEEAGLPVTDRMRDEAREKQK